MNSEISDQYTFPKIGEESEIILKRKWLLYEKIIEKSGPVEIRTQDLRRVKATS